MSLKNNYVVHLRLTKGKDENTARNRLTLKKKSCDWAAQAVGAPLRMRLPSKAFVTLLQ